MANYDEKSTDTVKVMSGLKSTAFKLSFNDKVGGFFQTPSS